MESLFIQVISSRVSPWISHNIFRIQLILSLMFDRCFWLRSILGGQLWGDGERRVLSISFRATLLWIKILIYEDQPILLVINNRCPVIGRSFTNSGKYLSPSQLWFNLWSIHLSGFMPVNDDDEQSQWSPLFGAFSVCAYNHRVWSLIFRSAEGGDLIWLPAFLASSGQPQSLHAAERIIEIMKRTISHLITNSQHSYSSLLL